MYSRMYACLVSIAWPSAYVLRLRLPLYVRVETDETTPSLSDKGAGEGNALATVLTSGVLSALTSGCLACVN